MQHSDQKRHTFDDWVRWAIGAGSGSVKPPDRVWPRIADGVANLEREACTPGLSCQQCASAGSKS